LARNARSNSPPRKIDLTTEARNTLAHPLGRITPLPEKWKSVKSSCPVRRTYQELGIVGGTYRGMATAAQAAIAINVAPQMRNEFSITLKFNWRSRNSFDVESLTPSEVDARVFLNRSGTYTPLMYLLLRAVVGVGLLGQGFDSLV